MDVGDRIYSFSSPSSSGQAEEKWVGWNGATLNYYKNVEFGGEREKQCMKLGYQTKDLWTELGVKELFMVLLSILLYHHLCICRDPPALKCGATETRRTHRAKAFFLFVDFFLISRYLTSMLFFYYYYGFFLRVSKSWAVPLPAACLSQGSRMGWRRLSDRTLIYYRTP